MSGYILIVQLAKNNEVRVVDVPEQNDLDKILEHYDGDAFIILNRDSKLAGNAAFVSRSIDNLLAL